MFDVAHDHGLHTGVFVTKEKMQVLSTTWDAERGAPDTTGEDDGRDKVDTLHCVPYQEDLPGQGVALTEAVLADLGNQAPRSLRFIHYSNPDFTGHAHGWDLTPGSPYLRSVIDVDTEIGRVLTAVEADETMQGRTAVIVTSDHGGGAPFKSHTRPEMWVNYIIPFMVWTGDDAETCDLYERNAITRKEPGVGRPGLEETPPPIRNADAANLALQLLGLPVVPGSTINAKQDLKIR